MNGFRSTLASCEDTNASKSGMSPDEYAMSRLMRPEKLGCDFMTAQAPYAPIECIDSRTGEAFAPTEDQSGSIRCKVPQLFLV